MNKKNQKVKINKTFIALIVVACVISIGITSVVVAGMSLRQMIATVAGERIAEGILGSEPAVEEDITVGAFPGPDVFIKMRFHDGFEGNSPIQIKLNQTGTSTAANPSPSGYYCNETGKRLSVDSNWYLGIATANDGFGSNWTIGTTTKLGDDSFTNTSTATLMLATAISTNTTGFYDRDTRSTLGSWYDDGINATTTPFNLDINACIVVTSDLSGATSSDETFTDGGGEDGYTPIIGAFHANASYRE